jgi:hypothetical protein
MLAFKSCLLFASAVTAAASIPQCCKTCEAGKDKYYSIPNPDEPDGGECGECCLKPGNVKFWKLFEPKLLKGDCATHGFTKYKSTEKDGVGPLSVTNDRYVKESSLLGKSLCPEKLQAVYADMHDGDKKEVIISGTSMTIKPSGNNQTWIVKARLDRKSCSAVVDFNVPGKPGPPPVNLTLTLWHSISSKGQTTEFEFTDPSGTLAAKDFPLNHWVELKWTSEKKLSTCPTSLKVVYADMHDGDKKEILVSGLSLTIKPSGNNQTWVVNSKIDAKSCSASIDFNVPGKPDPPPVNLQANLLYSFSSMGKKTEFEFTDPTGKLAHADFPLNHWVEISKASTEIVI